MGVFTDGEVGYMKEQRICRLATVDSAGHHGSGRAEIVPDGGEVLGPGFGPVWIRIVPTFISSWGIDGDPYGPSNSRKVSP